MEINAKLYEKMERQRKAAMLVDGRPYTAYVKEIKAMRKAGNHDEAAGVLIRIIEAIEREAAVVSPGRASVPPWYFAQLGGIYRKAGMHAEEAALHARFQAANLKARAGYHEAMRGCGIKLSPEAMASIPDPAAVVQPKPAAVAAGRWLGRMFGALRKVVK